MAVVSCFRVFVVVVTVVHGSMLEIFFWDPVSKAVVPVLSFERAQRSACHPEFHARQLSVEK